MKTATYTLAVVTGVAFLDGFFELGLPDGIFVILGFAQLAAVGYMLYKVNKN